MTDVQNYTELKKQRYERKFIHNSLQTKGIEQIIKINSGNFKEIYNKRYINNIYFDSESLSNYYENLSGKAERKKVRIRWYGDLFGEISTPILEIKIKNGIVGTKKSFKLKSFVLNNSISTNFLKDLFSNSNIPENILNYLITLKPTLINRYNRKYFLDFSKKFRLTLDSDLQFIDVRHRNNTLKNTVKDYKTKVVEIKYDVENDTKVDFITTKFPFRMTKISKYVAGIELFNRIAL